MPVGPIWAPHSFYTLSSALMLFWYVRYEDSKRHRGSARVDRATDPRPPVSDALVVFEEPPPGEVLTLWRQRDVDTHVRSIRRTCS